MIYEKLIMVGLVLMVGGGLIYAISKAIGGIETCAECGRELPQEDMNVYQDALAEYYVCKDCDRKH